MNEELERVRLLVDSCRQIWARRAEGNLATAGTMLPSSKATSLRAGARTFHRCADDLQFVLNAIDREIEYGRRRAEREASSAPSASR